MNHGKCPLLACGCGDAAQGESAGVYWFVTLAGTIALLLLYARDDSKMMLSFSFAPLALATLRRKGVGATMALGVGLAAVYVLFITPLVTTMRATVRPNELGERSLLDRSAGDKVLTEMGSSFRDAPADYFSLWLDQTMLRLNDSVPAGYISQIAEAHGLLNGAGMQYVPMSFVPRILWHDKPVIDRGTYFTVFLGTAASEDTASTSTGQTGAGELFWNFGWPGVVIGMYFLGAALSGAWSAAGRGNPINGVLEMTAFMGAMLSFVLGVGSAAGSVFVPAISAGIVLRVLIRVRDWIFRRKRYYRQCAVPAAYPAAPCR